MFSCKPDKIKNYGMNLYLAFRKELITGGAPVHSPALIGLMDLLSRWKETNDPSYLDLFLINAQRYQVTFGQAIVWELAKAAARRSSGHFKDREGTKAQKAKIEYIRKAACQWIYILRTYCGLNFESAKELAAARLYYENKDKNISVELKPDSLGKYYNQLYSQSVLNELQSEPQNDYWTDQKIEDFKAQFSFILPEHLLPNSRD